MKDILRVIIFILFFGMLVGWKKLGLLFLFGIILLMVISVISSVTEEHKDKVRRAQKQKEGQKERLEKEEKERLRRIYIEKKRYREKVRRVEAQKKQEKQIYKRGLEEFNKGNWAKAIKIFANLPSFLVQDKTREAKKELDKQNYNKGLVHFNNKNWQSALLSLRSISQNSFCYENSLKRINEITKIVQDEKDRLNYKQGLENFNQKNWQEVIFLMVKISPNFLHYSDTQRKLKKARQQFEKWENFIKKVELFNNEARKIDREIKLAFSSVEDGVGSGISERRKELESLKLRIVKLLKQAESVYPMGTKEFWISKLKEKERKEHEEKMKWEIYRKEANRPPVRDGLYFSPRKR